MDADILYRQKAVLVKLKDDGYPNVSKQAFSQAVTRGTIPYRTVEGTTRKMYNYEAVLYAIKSSGLFDSSSHTSRVPEDKNSSENPETKEEDQSREALKERLNTNPKLSDANTLKTIIALEREQLKLDEENGLLVSRAEMEDTAFQIARIVRDKLLTVPERLANELASMNDPHVIKELLFKEFGILLEGFSQETLIPKKESAND